MSDLTPRESEAICRCYQEFFKDSQNKPASIARVALIFQITDRTVYKVLHQKNQGIPFAPVRRPGREQVPAFKDYGFKEHLNDHILAEIKKNEHVTIQKIYQYAKECLDFEHSATTLYRIIRAMGYRYKKADRRKVLIETQRIVNLRICFCKRYLELLKQASQNEIEFIFLDETWVYQNGSPIRQWILENHPQGVPTKFKSEGKRYTIVHAGCREGFLPGCDLILDSKINDRDYHKTMNGELFTKWVQNQLIPALHSLRKKCVVVMDNAPYHSMKREKPPTTSSNKEDLQKWLQTRGIPYEETSTKKQLWALIQPTLTGQNYIKYEIDEILQDAGHEVLRLPPYNCQYNAIELAWGNCKTYYNANISSHLDDKERVKRVWSEALQQCTKNKWQNFIEHADNEVKKDWKKYMGVDEVDAVPPFIINLQSDSDSDSDFSDVDDSDVNASAEGTISESLVSANEPFTSEFQIMDEEITLMIVDD